MSEILPPPAVIRACFIDRLRELRAAKFSSPRDFARALGMEEVHYLRYERGELEPNLTLIVHVCFVLRAAPNDLFPDLPKLATLAPKTRASP